MVLAGTLVLAAVFATAQEKEPGAHRKVLSRVVPTYPQMAKQFELQGNVRIVATVAPDGKVKSIQVIGGSPVLARAAEDAVLKWKFAAASEETTEFIEFHFNPE